MFKAPFIRNGHERPGNWACILNEMALLEKQFVYLSKEEAGISSRLPSNPVTTLPFRLTSILRISSAFFIPFLCATFLSSFKPLSGLLVTISHREDSTSHLMKQEQTGIVNPRLLICYMIIDNMFYVSHLLSTTSTRHSCCVKLILGKYESDNSMPGWQTWRQIAFMLIQQEFFLEVDEG